MIAKKGPVLTMDAFRRALEAYPEMHLDFVGEGELLPAVRQFVEAFALEHDVTVHGGLPSEDVQRLMDAADIFLQHSITDPDTGDEEGLPVAILEAMARSLAVVSTHHAGIPEAVAEGATGYLVKEGDSAGMAERIVTLATDAERRQRMGVAGWERAGAHFTWERERESLLSVMNLASPSMGGPSAAQGNSI
jgi:glycosyltransferase involved in cell wall biosynthesis